MELWCEFFFGDDGLGVLGVVIYKEGGIMIVFRSGAVGVVSWNLDGDIKK